MKFTGLAEALINAFHQHGPKALSWRSSIHRGNFASSVLMAVHTAEEVDADRAYRKGEQHADGTLCPRYAWQVEPWDRQES